MRLTALSRKPGGLAPLPTSWVAFARRICFSSLAIPHRAGRAALHSQAQRSCFTPPIGVVIASATANAREAPTRPVSCNSLASMFGRN